MFVWIAIVVVLAVATVFVQNQKKRKKLENFLLWCLICSGVLAVYSFFVYVRISPSEAF